MDFDAQWQWFLLGLPLFFVLGWLGSRFDLRQLKRETRESPKAYYKGLSLQRCALYNPGDKAAATGSGARFLAPDDSRKTATKRP